MTAAGAADWDRVQQVFHAALERSPQTRSPFLNETCGQDAALRAEVESLLAAHEAAGASFLGQPVVERRSTVPCTAVIASARLRSSSCWGLVGWARSTAPTTRSWGVTSRAQGPAAAADDE
jgi:hypothetical protein